MIASDGVWEFLQNEEVARIVLPYYEQNAPEAAANALVKASYKKWKQVRFLSLLGRRGRRRHYCGNNLFGALYGLQQCSATWRLNKYLLLA